MIIENRNKIKYQENVINIENPSETLIDENNISEPFIPEVILKLKEHIYYRNNHYILKDMMKIYNEAVQACIVTIQNEYSFLKSNKEYVRHLKEILAKNMIEI